MKIRSAYHLIITPGTRDESIKNMIIKYILGIIDPLSSDNVTIYWQ